MNINSFSYSDFKKKRLEQALERLDEVVDSLDDIYGYLSTDAKHLPMAYLYAKKAEENISDLTIVLNAVQKCFDQDPGGFYELN